MDLRERIGKIWTHFVIARVRDILRWRNESRLLYLRIMGEILRIGLRILKIYRNSVSLIGQKRWIELR